MINEIVTLSSPKSPIAEAIKTIRTNLQFTDTNNELKTILLTSSISGEGKSVVSANLAVAYAKANKKTLLIDADMRRGRQHEVFKVSTSKGYSNLLIDDPKNYGGYIQKTNIENLSIISRGVVPPNPSELLQSQKNKDLIDLLKGKYDIIIFDGIPVIGLTDSVILSSMVDKTLIVCAALETQMEMLLETQKTLEAVNCDIAGVIVNKVRDKNMYNNKYYY